MRPFPVLDRPSWMKSEIRWPDRFSPARTAVFVSNEIIIAAEPEEVWRWLIRAEMWPHWYPNSSDIHFLSTSGPDLRERSRFRWNTFGLRITSKVLEFEPSTRLAWEAQGIGIDAYHAWLLTPTNKGGTHVLTQETQHGSLARLGKMMMPRRMETMHQLWLETLKTRVLTGPPPETPTIAKRRAPERTSTKYIEG